VAELNNGETNLTCVVGRPWHYEESLGVG